MCSTKIIKLEIVLLGFKKNPNFSIKVRKHGNIGTKEKVFFLLAWLF